MTEYLDYFGALVRVAELFDGRFVAARVNSKGSARHVKSPLLPTRESAEEAQIDLDAYAQQRKWRRVE